LAESLWLGEPDMLLAYPTTDRASLARMPENGPVLMVASTDHLDLIESATNVPVRLCIELDLSYPIAGGRIKIGAKRSPIRTPEEAVALAREIERRPRLRLAGIMGYEAHIAGLGDRPPGKRLMSKAIERLQKASANEITERRAAVVKALPPLDFVNGGGTGSLHTTTREDV